MEKIAIGIDFSKETFDMTVLDTKKTNGKVDADALAKAPHEQFENRRSGFRKSLSWARKVTGRKLDKDNAIFCGEATGKYSVRMSEYLREQGLFVWIDSGLRIKNSMGIVRGKSDKADSCRIAEYAFRHWDKAELYEPLKKDISALRELFLYRNHLVDLRKAAEQRNSLMKEFSDVVGESSFIRRSGDRIVKDLKEEIKRCEEEMRKLIESNKELKTTFECITSIKGVSLINGVAFIVYTNNFEWFGNNPRKIATYWGVAVFGKESGTSVKGKTKTSKCASRKLKKLISEAATCAIRWEPRIKAYYQKMRDKGKHHGVAMNNVKNKLIHIITALAVNKTKYCDTYEEDRKLRKAG
jgi:transposase